MRYLPHGFHAFVSGARLLGLWQCCASPSLPVLPSLLFPCFRQVAWRVQERECMLSCCIKQAMSPCCTKPSQRGCGCFCLPVQIAAKPPESLLSHSSHRMWDTSHTHHRAATARDSRRLPLMTKHFCHAPTPHSCSSRPCCKAHAPIVLSDCLPHSCTISHSLPGCTHSSCTRSPLTAYLIRAPPPTVSLSAPTAHAHALTVLSDCIPHSCTTSHSLFVCAHSSCSCTHRPL